MLRRKNIKRITMKMLLIDLQLAYHKNNIPQNPKTEK